MILRVLLAVFMALGLAGFGTIAAVSSRSHVSQAAATQPANNPTMQLIAVAKPLRAGELIKPDDLTAVAVRGTRFPRARWRTIRRRESPWWAPSCAGESPPTCRSPPSICCARAIMASSPPCCGRASARSPWRSTPVSGSAGLIWPGDEVDLVLTQALDAASAAPGRRVVAETVLRGARVIAIDQHLADGPAPGSAEAAAERTVTLEVSTAEAEKVEVAARIGKLSLVVRATDRGDQPGDAGATGPTWASDVSSALDAPAPPPASGPSVVHVYTGAADGKEFKF